MLTIALPQDQEQLVDDDLSVFYGRYVPMMKVYPAYSSAFGGSFSSYVLDHQRVENGEYQSSSASGLNALTHGYSLHTARIRPGHLYLSLPVRESPQAHN
jgi:hypothetical protein